MRVAELMQTDVRTIAPDASIADLVQVLADAHVSGLPVVNPDGRVIGVVSATDVLQAGAEQDDAKARAHLFERITVRDIMTPRVVTVRPTQTVDECMALMTDHRIRHLPVLEGERVIGVLSIGDLVKAVIEDQRETIKQLETYIHT